MKNYFFDNGKFIIRDFASQHPFTDFLPGIAGLDGRPVWAFFVNRGQGVAGFGVGGKDNPIMEFSPAEIAYSRVPQDGFRTFIKVDGKFHEPFAVGGKLPTKMEIYRSGFAIEEYSDESSVRAEYFVVPNRNYAALGRVVRYSNLTDKPQRLEILDGLAQMLPFGLSNTQFKESGNLMKSWAVAEGLEDGLAFVRMRSSTADCSTVRAVTQGNFFLPVDCSKVIVNGRSIFGEDRTRLYATVFEEKGVTDQPQVTENELFCAFAYRSVTVQPHSAVTFCALFGSAESLQKVREIKRSLTAEEVLKMQREANAVAEQIASKVETHTAFPLFDEYVKQSYFDNVLRGGMPVAIGDVPYYVYSRKHGDPERDYNCFYIAPTPYSAGNGNFRDVVQNRRNDVFVTPYCKDFNVKYFFSLLQADGYNPLVVNGVSFTCRSVPAKYAAYGEFLQGTFTVGEAAAELGIDDGELCELISQCAPVYRAEFGEGYWSDHFVYLIDLLTAYLAVYPDKQEQLLYNEPIAWFESDAQVLPRNKRCAEENGNVHRVNSVVRSGKSGWKKSGSQFYITSLAAKLLFLALVKTASLDYLGCGIDMEAGKPGWCDALNGLPAMFGSNVADMLELLRLVKILRSFRLRNVKLCAEQHSFFTRTLELLRRDPSPQEFYNAVNDVKESYLASVYGGAFGGEMREVSAEEAEEFLSLAERRLSRGAERAKQMADGWIPTYLTYKPTAFRNGDGIVPTAFEPHVLPHFAEGVAKSLALGDVLSYERAKNSQMYDKLGLFRTSEPLRDEPLSVGRIRSFPEGWLERESCFLHMHCKLLLSLLVAGQYDEFYSRIRTGLIPFIDPEQYGRSAVQNSSFIVTSNCTDPHKVGKGYQARLTGANAEVLSMWRYMMGAEQPFTMQNGKLCFRLQPKLHKDFFEDGKACFTLFGTTRVVYDNQSCRNAWQTEVVRYKLKRYGEEPITVKEVTGDLAENVRNGKYYEIEVQLK